MIPTYELPPPVHTPAALIQAYDQGSSLVSRLGTQSDTNFRTAVSNPPYSEPLPQVSRFSPATRNELDFGMELASIANEVLPAPTASRPNGKLLHRMAILASSRK